jgi:uncharacterized membrane protein YeaQ/YmgE (transglycosylase-associated protein family)
LNRVYRGIEHPATARLAGEEFMGWIIALIVGGVAGWLASKVMDRDASMGIFWNIVVGCVGSGVGNVVANQFGIAGSVRQFSLTGLIVAFVGAVILLGVANLIQRGRVR